MTEDETYGSSDESRPDVVEFVRLGGAGYDAIWRKNCCEYYIIPAQSHGDIPLQLQEEMRGKQLEEGDGTLEKDNDIIALFEVLDTVGLESRVASRVFVPLVLPKGLDTYI